MKNSCAIRSHIYIHLTHYLTFIIQEQILKDLKKYKLYDELDSFVDKSNYNSYCRNIQIFSPHNKYLDEICYKIARNIIKLPTILMGETNSERCRYIIFGCIIK